MKDKPGYDGANQSMSRKGSCEDRGKVMMGEVAWLWHRMEVRKGMKELTGGFGWICDCLRLSSLSSSWALCSVQRLGCVACLASFETTMVTEDLYLLGIA